MTTQPETNETERIAAARESFSGRLLTDAQFDEAIAITNILEREIKKTGTFKDKLGDYAFAFARSERFDVARSENTIRDLFKERTGQSMNQFREALVEQETSVLETDDARQAAYQLAADIGDLIEHGDKMSFNRAYAQQGHALANQFGITDASAKRLMAEEFKAVERTELYDWGKDLEERFYRPQIEAEKQEREAARSRNTNRSETRSTASRTNGAATTTRSAPRPRA